MAVDAGTDPPYFAVRPSSFYQRQPAQSVVMPCVADGEPRPTISWKKVLHTHTHARARTHTHAHAHTLYCPQFCIMFHVIPIRVFSFIMLTHPPTDNPRTPHDKLITVSALP